jgi:hypothetical protein
VYGAQLLLALFEEHLERASLLLHGIPLGHCLASDAVQLAVLFLQLHKHVANCLMQIMYGV